MTLSDDMLIEELAAGQLGLVTWAQLRERGVSARVIGRRVQAKRLRPLHRGVYRVGPLVDPNARELAAVLACGAHAVVSYWSAGWLRQWLPDPGNAAPVDISLRQGNRDRPGIRIHRVCLPTDDITVLQNIPITSIRRTLADLSGVLSSKELERVLAKVERMNLIERRDLQSLAECRAGQRGARMLRALLENDGGPAFTRSEAEARFLALVRKVQLPEPETNGRVGDYEVDFFWRRERLVVEVDGFAYHSSPRKFETDRRRDAWLAAQGATVMRVTWRQLEKEPEAMLVRLGQALAKSSQ